MEVDPSIVSQFSIDDLRFQIATKRQEVETYNVKSASERMRLFKMLRDQTLTIKELLINEHIPIDVVQTFSQLLNVFRSSFIDGHSQESQIKVLVAARIGLEVVRNGFNVPISL